MIHMLFSEYLPAVQIFFTASKNSFKQFLSEQFLSVANAVVFTKNVETLDLSLHRPFPNPFQKKRGKKKKKSKPILKLKTLKVPVS